MGQGEGFDIESIKEMLLGVLRDALPRRVTDDTVRRAFAGAQEQELQISPIYEQLLDPEKRIENPYWGFDLVAPDGTKARFLTSKSLEEPDGSVMPPERILIWLATFGLLCAPVARAVLLGLGYRFKFVWAQKKPPENPLH